ncbi:hypothetical protein KCU88_g5775, partial [Aureobasidium melanogenum]
MSTIRVGDTVTVPGDMHGVVKFIGPVAGKKGTFAGVQLAPEYAPRGKNSGEVDGRQYFRTTIPGSGIFLPLEKAVKKSAGLGGNGIRPSPGTPTPTRLSSFNQGGRTPAIAKPNFSQSIGPGVRNGAASPALKPPVRRESLPRPSSPLRKTANTPTPRTTLATPKTRPSGIGLAKNSSTNGGGLGHHYGATTQTRRGNNTFSQTLRQSSANTTPNRSAAGSGASPSLGPESSFDESQEPNVTPTPTPHVNRNAADAGGNAAAAAATAKYETKIRQLNEELGEARRQLSEQSSTVAEMERNFNELQKLLPGLESGQAGGGKGPRGGEADEEELPRDVTSLREIIRGKNEKIKLLTAEFDAHRADFRSTIDTLEMASTETERVYEKRVDELLEEIRTLQDRSEDVESVAQQLKQLEELVLELEEGLEDARRGEAEARSEVEFLRGEVERSRSELRRERERLKTEEQLNGYSASNVQDLEAQLNAKDDEIRGLKAIIQSLNESHHKTNDVSHETDQNAAQRAKTNTSTHTPQEGGDEDVRLSLQQQIRDLEALLQQKNAHEEELENEVKQLRNSVTLSKFPMPASPFGIHTGMRHSRGNSEDLPDGGGGKHQSTGTTGSQKTVVMSGSSTSPTARRGRFDKSLQDNWGHTSTTTADGSPVKRRQQYSRQHGGNERNNGDDNDDDVVTDISTASQANANANANGALWCEICEEGGHDILSCTNMFSNEQQQGPPGTKRDPKFEERDRPSSLNRDRPAPLMMGLNRVKNTGSQPLQSSSLDDDGIDDDDGDGVNDVPPSPPPKDTHNNNKSGSAPALIEGTGAQAGMLAGRTSGVIDPEKWCALCERDGHDSVDCPLEDAF